MSRAVVASEANPVRRCSFSTESCEPVAASVKALLAIPGVGLKTAAALVALLPELGATTGKRIAALAGLAPHPDQSGAAERYRFVRGGRPEVKRTLFMAAPSARKHHPRLSTNASTPTAKSRSSPSCKNS